MTMDGAEAGAGHADEAVAGAGHVCGEGCPDEWENKVFWIDMRTGDVRAGGRGNVGLAFWVTLQRHLSLWPRAVAPSRMFPEKTSCTTTQTVARSLCVSCVLPPFHSCCVLFAQFSKSHSNSDAARSARCLQLMKQRLPRGRLTTPRDG